VQESKCMHEQVNTLEIMNAQKREKIRNDMDWYCWG